MNDLDRRIQDALQSSTAGHELAREQGLAEELIGAFRTRHHWLHAFALVLTFAFFVVAIYSGYRFATADSAHEQLAWAGACVLGFVFTGFLKIWFWLELHTNRVLREIKRVELLLIMRDRSSSPNRSAP